MNIEELPLHTLKLRPLSLLVLLSSTVVSAPNWAQGSTSAAELAKQTLNPIAALYSLPIQYNQDYKMGAGHEGTRTVTNIQPVLPFTLNEDWNLISRTILPLIDQQDLAPNGRGDASGTGDVTQSLFFSPSRPSDSGWIWGAGPALLLPTGSDELLSGEQWAAGPTVVALKQSNGWTHGVLANHLWALESTPQDKERINQTYFQPFLAYTTDTFTSLGVNTESTYNWESRQWSVPLNVFVTQILKVGRQPLSIQAGPRYWLESPENGAEDWGFRVALTLLFPK